MPCVRPVPAQLRHNGSREEFSGGDAVPVLGFDDSIETYCKDIVAEINAKQKAAKKKANCHPNCQPKRRLSERSEVQTIEQTTASPPRGPRRSASDLAPRAASSGRGAPVAGQNASRDAQPAREGQPSPPRLSSRGRRLQAYAHDCVLASRNILLLFGDNVHQTGAGYNSCRNLEWQMCAAAGKVPSRGCHSNRVLFRRCAAEES